MRAFAMTGIETASWIPLIISGSLMRATPPSRRMSAGTRSSAMTATAPASSAIFACSALTTSMITPPLSISASPALTRNVASSRMKSSLAAGLLESEGLYPLRVLRRVAAVHAVGQRLDHAQQRGVRADVGRRVRRVVQADLGELGDLAQRRVGDRDRLRLAVARQLHRAHDERMGAPRAQADDERVGVDARELAERLLRRRGDDVGAQVEQREQVAQVRREERHLVGADDQHARRGGEGVDRGLDVGARHLARRLLDVDVIGGQRGLELALVEREQRLGGGRADPAPPTRRVHAPVLVARGALQLGEALEAERLREAHDGGARGVRAPRELLRGLEGRLVEVVDDVLRDVLLGARELVEPGLDVRGEGLVLGALVRQRGRRRSALHVRRALSPPLQTLLPRTTNDPREARRSGQTEFSALLSAGTKGAGLGGEAEPGPWLVCCLYRTPHRELATNVNLSGCWPCASRTYLRFPA